MHKSLRQSDGKYHLGSSKFDLLVGTRAQVHHGTAYKTAGGLKKEHLLQNKNGRIVSKKKHETARREKRLEKHGFFAQKGKFGMVRGTPKGSPKKRTMKRRAHTIG